MLTNTTLLSIDLHHLVLSICYALLHSLWLGVVAAAFAGLVIAATTRSNPAVRYNMLLGISGLFVLASVACFFISYSQLPEFTKVTTTVGNLEGNVFVYDANVAPVTATPFWQKLVNGINAYADILVACWLVVFLWKAIKLVVGMRGLEQCRVQGTQTPNEEWVARVQELAQELKIGRVVQILESVLVKVPCTIGYFKPVILVPLGMFTLLSPAQVESILLHELAHVRRRDFAINIFLECIETVFFFNPAVYWLLTVIRQEREVCCDAMVTAYSNQPKQYMEALVTFQEQFNQVAYTMPLTGRHSLLLDRIKRMINKKNKNLTSMEKILLSLSIVAVVSFSFIPADAVKKTNEKSAHILSTKQTIVAATLEEPVNATVINTIEKSAFENSDQAMADTIGKPNKKDSITGVHIYTNASPTKEIEYTEITVKSGNRYKIGKEKGVIVSFSINGKERDVKEAARFSGMIKEIEAKSAQVEKDRQQMEKDRVIAEQQRKEIEVQRIEIEKERGELEQKRVEAEDKKEKEEIIIEQREIEVKQKKIEAEHKKIESQQRKLEMQRHQMEAGQKKQTHSLHREHSFHIQDSLTAIQKQKVKDVIQLLVQNGVVKNAESVQWFSLTKDALMVNGAKQDASLHEQLMKTTFTIPSNMGLYYGDVPGTAFGYKFGKHEINVGK
ncbi:M56 family metallopeptidase [Flavisolibacter tropicus]|uniref:Peptidase M56 domain-containing protein n=1 Tax=Flavisolibacter tropicus TaxID=1492898 RepID=A0A172TVG1_9BACT|nr:M56 family metallopeptidase [Flavisolibacter tropicus]ANE50958.1 hypothetical protein SY85_11045 [Flavisolibacter tropicus]